jgi:D-alanyl-D-alanine carboxypeptidase
VDRCVALGALVAVTDLDARLQALVERDVEEWPAMPGRLLHVLVPGSGVDVEVAAGVADRATDEPLRPGARFRIASVTKPFVGASALRLVELGMLQLDASLDSLLPGVYVDVLHTGGYDTGTITLRHLLTHTSGIYDFAASAYDASITDGFDQAIAADPSHRWTRLEQVRFAMDHGAPYGAPGEVYGYSDTNACLVGELLEQTTDLGMGEAIAGLVGFGRLGLRQTYLESIDPEPADAPQWSHQYERGVDIATIDPSVDLWGGGGLVSTSRDLARFFRALLRDEVFERPETLATMTTRLEDVPRAADMTSDEDPRDRAMYLFHTEIAGEEWWGHGGWWGTAAYTCPRLDVTIVAGHQQAYMPEDFDRMTLISQAYEAVTAIVGGP